MSSKSIPCSVFEGFVPAFPYRRENLKELQVAVLEGGVAAAALCPRRSDRERQLLLAWRMNVRIKLTACCDQLALGPGQIWDELGLESRVTPLLVSSLVRCSIQVFHESGEKLFRLGGYLSAREERVSSPHHQVFSEVGGVGRSIQSKVLVV